MLQFLITLAFMLGSLSPPSLPSWPCQTPCPVPPVAAPVQENETAWEVLHEITAAGGAARHLASLTPELRTKIDGWVRQYARQYRVEEKLVRAVLRQESGGNPLAVSPKGALGLMQLMPETAALMGVADPFDPEQNLAGGIRYLRLCLNLFKEDTALALAAYNAGPQNVERFGGIPPFPETQQYVTSILGSCPTPAGLNQEAAKTAPPSRPQAAVGHEPTGLNWRLPSSTWKIAAPQTKVAGPQWKVGPGGLHYQVQEIKTLRKVPPGRPGPASPLAQSRLGGAKGAGANTP